MPMRLEIGVGLVDEDQNAPGFASATGFEGTGVPAFEGAAAVAAAAFTACWQPDDSFAGLLSRHCSAWEPPRGTLLQ